MDLVAVSPRIFPISVKFDLQFELADAQKGTADAAIAACTRPAPDAIRATRGQLEAPRDLPGSEPIRSVCRLSHVAQLV